MWTSGGLGLEPADATLIGLGANLPGPDGEAPEATVRAALRALNGARVRVVARSRLYRSAPVPESDQPWFVNAVARVETALGPEALMAALLAIEDRFGRTRRGRWEARILDLDLLAYGNRVITGDAGGGSLVLPHPRMHERAFVLLPLREILPGWHHPRSGRSIARMIEDLEPAARRTCVPMETP